MTHQNLRLTPSELSSLASLPERDIQRLLANFSERDEALAAEILRQLQEYRYSATDKEAVASFFGVSLDTIDLWQRKGMPYTSRGRGVRGSYDLAECARWIVRRSTSAQDDDDDSSAAVSYREEKAKIAALQRQKMEGDLVPIEEVRREILKVCVMIRKGVEGFHRSYGNDAVEMLSDIIREALESLGIAPPDEIE